jgi:hypothetical protein
VDLSHGGELALKAFLIPNFVHRHAVREYPFSRQLETKPPSQHFVILNIGRQVDLLRGILSHTNWTFMGERLCAGVLF